MPSEAQSASAFTSPPDAEWIELAHETARRHPLFGVRGWLVFFVFLFEFFIIINVGNLIVPTDLFPVPNQYLIMADTGLMAVMLILILAKLDIVGPAVWAWVSFHFLGLIFAYSEFGADGAVTENEKIILAGYALLFLLRDIPTVWYFTSSRRVNITMNGRLRPNDPFIEDIISHRANGLDHTESAQQSETPQQDDLAHDPPERFGSKECPACAEIIKSQARACRYCGYHFLNGSSPAEPVNHNENSTFDISKATRSTEKIDVPVVMNSVDLVEYRGFFIAEMENGKFQILSESGRKLRKSGDYDSSEYAKSTLDYFITIAVELMSYPASMPKTD